MKRPRIPARKRKASFPQPRPKPKVKKKEGGSGRQSAPPDVPRTKPPKPSEKRPVKSSTTRRGSQGKRVKSGIPPRRGDSYKSQPKAKPKRPSKPGDGRKGGGKRKPPPPPVKPVSKKPKRPRKPKRTWEEWVEAAQEIGAHPKDEVPDKDMAYYQYIAEQTAMDPADIYAALMGSPRDGM